MGSLVLSAIGGGIGGPAGAFIGGVIGAAFDQLVLIPAITPTQTAKGPRVESLKLQQATEGASMQTVLGPRNRVPGQIVWQTDLIPVTTTTDSGGGKGGGGGSKVETTKYFVSMAVVFADTEKIPVNRIRRIIATGGKVIYDGVPSSPRYASIALYNGAHTTIDPTMQAALGAGNVPKYKKSAFVVFDRIEVTDFGNMPPQLNAILEQDNDVSLQEAIGRLMERAGLESDQYDTSRIPFCLRGYTIPDPQKTTDTIAPLMLGFGVALQESNAQLVFIPQGSEDEFTVPLSDLGAHDPSDGDDAPRLIRFTDQDDITVPGIVNVKFFDNENQIQPGAIPAVRADHPNKNVMTANIAVTMTSAEADAAGQRILWSYEAERQPVQLSLPPSYIFLQEHDALLVRDEAGTLHRFVVGTVDRGSNSLIQVTGRTSCAATFTQAGDGTAAPGGGGTPYSPPETTGYVFDGPALIEAHTSKIGLYFAATLLVTTDLWNGANLYSSSDNVTYLQRGRAPSEAILGTTTQGLSRFANPDAWDRHSILVVSLINGSASSVTEEACLAGANRFGVRTPSGEWEVIGAATVTQLDATTFMFTNILRGLRGTEHLIDRHLLAGSPFLALTNDGSINWWERGSAGLGTNDYYKLPATGGVISEYAYQRVQITGKTMRPFAPVHLELQRGPDIILSGTDIAANSVLGAFTSTTANRFKGIEVGQPIQTDGYANAGNNSSFVVVSKPNQQTLVVGPLTMEAAGPLVVLKRGGANDVPITWVRRSKGFSGAFATPDSPPLAADETPETFEIEFRRGGPLTTPVRTVTVSGVNSYVYTADERTADGVNTGDVLVTVYQISTAVGRSVGASRRLDA